MANYRTSRILPTILTIVIIIIAIAGLVALARFVFTGSTSKSQPTVDVSQQQLLDTSDGHAVSMIVRGPIVANEDFRSYSVTVSAVSREFQSYTGYLDTVTNQQTFTNNTAAYDQFVHALDKANMVAGKPFEGDKNNVLGVCATGKVYQFSLLNNGTTEKMLWTSTCSGSVGSLKGSATQLSSLFLNQIPNGVKITTSLAL
ncbi:MAG: hypothetical protein ACOH18_04030 [Candidatus Saccharimonadaceae bacterium]